MVNPYTSLSSELSPTIVEVLIIEEAISPENLPYLAYKYPFLVT
jgi:hypothetical protein